MIHYISEVLPALVAMFVMGLVAIVLVILFETLRSHMKLAFAGRKSKHPVERIQFEAKLPESIVEEESIEDSSAEDLRFDGDLGMFAGDFADEAEPAQAVQDIVRESIQPPQQADFFPEEPAAQDPEREGKQRRREREAKTDRRGRKGEKRQRAGDAADESRRARKERNAVPEDAHEQRQRRKNRQ